MEDIDKMEAVARAATPGPWIVPHHGLSVHQKHAPCTAVAFTMSRSGGLENHSANAEHIATFNPATVLRLLAVVRAAREAFVVMDLAHPNDERTDALEAALKELS